jgi:hypothetical protein
MVKETPDPPDFDDDDRATLRAMIDDFRSRKAVREQLKTWGKYFLVASGALLALTQIRDAIRTWLQIVKGGP